MHGALTAAASPLGGDATAEGRGGYIPFARRRQFAAVARDRVNPGLRFTNPPAPPRPRPATAPGQATHKLAPRSAADIDEQTPRLLRAAFEQGD